MDEKLMMVIGLVDQITKPLQGITNKINGAMDTAKSGMQDMVTGGAGLVATGFAIVEALSPAVEMNRALGDVKALGVIEEDLESLKYAAYEFSDAYGRSALEFINNSALMKNVYGNVSGDVLEGITKNSSTLAIAMKSDAETVAKFMKTVYGNYKSDADAMGLEKFTATVAGMVGKAREIYGINMDTMEGAIDGMHSLTSTLGVTFDEQLTVLSMLQKSMGEGDAVTQYTNFLEGAIGAQEKLGVSLTDSNGQLLPMMQILEKIKPLIQGMSGIEARYLLDEAGLGDGSLMLINLIENMGDFKNGLHEINSIKGMENVEKMAAAMTDQSQRLEASWFAIRTAAFSALLPAFNAVTGSIADGLMWLTSMTSEYPVLTEVLSYAAIGALSLGGVVASLSLVMGIAKMMAGGWAVTTAVLSGVFKVLRISTIAMTAATWLFNAALWANPITWIIAGIVALVAAVGAMIYWWDEIKASFADTTWFKIIAAAIDGVIEMLNMIPGINIEWRAGELPDVPVPETQPAIAKAVPVLPDVAALEASRPSMDSTLIDYKRPENTPQLSKNMVNNLNSSESRTTHNVRQYGDVYITPQGGMTPEQLAEWDELNAG
ncbi:phage tail tape measure protein [Vibrio cholerae]|uniref:phage tail tape measure protein n=1 Tax=Vibrio cholerae TaxID=666 RepID=UPI0011D783D9|nr:phage tail tape measure protein [Vibrio cholerae]TXX57045.1 phage tail tape measure protein [Vibrio cholerae]